MPPLLQQALGSILRWALTFLAGFFIQRGIWTEAEATTYVAGAVVAILTLLWSLWQKYRAHLRILAALDLPAGSSVEQLDARRR